MNENTRIAFETLFGIPDADGTLQFDKTPPLAMIRGIVTGDEVTAAACLNAVAHQNFPNGVAAEIMRIIWDRLVANGINTKSLRTRPFDAETRFWLGKVRDLLAGIHERTEELARSMPNRIIPSATAIFDRLPCHNDCIDIDGLAESLAELDMFSDAGAFNYTNGDFMRIEPDSRKDVKDFYGFPSVRANILDHFRAFEKGENNTPLLLHSLPGYGKTSMITSYAMSVGRNSLILSSPETLSHGWDAMIKPLARRNDRKFVIFFDDIEPDKIDWYAFRTNVGGAFSVPSHILVVLSSNYEFPASILSRGRSIVFPVFDAMRCSEIIYDFLVGMGLRNPPANLVSLMGADYLEAFGQKKFTELSPRTLMRHLEVFRTNKIKRKTLVDMIDSPVITKPSPELFYEFNINLMRRLYGDEYIAKLREEKLRNL